MLFVCQVYRAFPELLSLNSMLIGSAVDDKVPDPLSHKLCSFQVKLATTICGDPECVVGYTILLSLQPGQARV